MAGRGIQVVGVLGAALGCAILVGGLRGGGFEPFFLVLFVPVWLGLIVGGVALVRHGGTVARADAQHDDADAGDADAALDEAIRQDVRNADQQVVDVDASGSLSWEQR